MRRETPPGVPQSQSDVLYYNRHSIDFSQRSVSWEGDSKSIANWIRALIFPPLQFPVINIGRSQLDISAVRWDRRPHRGRPGQILAVEDTGITVAAAGGRLTLSLRDAGAEIDPSALAGMGLAVGAVLS